MKTYLTKTYCQWEAPGTEEARLKEYAYGATDAALRYIEMRWPSPYSLPPPPDMLISSILFIPVPGHSQIGFVERAGIPSKSTACGALCAFESEIESGHVDLKLDMMDVEQCMLKQVCTKVVMWCVCNELCAICGPTSTALLLKVHFLSIKPWGPRVQSKKKKQGSLAGINKAKAKNDPTLPVSTTVNIYIYSTYICMYVCIVYE